MPSRPVVEPNNTTRFPGPVIARARHAIGGEQPDAHRVDEAVARVALVEDSFAPDGGYADAVPVVADAAHGPREHPARATVGRIAEAQRVEKRHGSGAHRHDVSEDSTDARRRALEGLDGRRVVVALDLEGNREPFADVDDAGVLARSLEDGGASSRESLQERRRMLVPAMLGPEEAEDRKLEVIWRPVEQSTDTVELPVRQAERAVKRLFCDRGQRRVTSLPSEEAGGAAEGRTGPTSQG